ncbi:hypothetical protein [Sphingomonas sp. GV3]|uniref:hypothetical protein n=1 Tax=Sphingomonas sp. GV3 TaxID=3040671 RepID=UPI00280AD3EA|nr:hypothetical protein [Sphingomonas sp. GV3]
MVSLPAKCSACGHISETSFGLFGPNISMVGNYTRCPQCGGTAEIIDGVFDLSGDDVKVKSAPLWSRETIAAIQKIAKKASDDNLSARDIIQEVAGFSPDLAEKLKKRNLSAVILVALLLFILKNCSVNATVDINRLIEQGITAVSGTVSPAAAPPSHPLLREKKSSEGEVAQPPFQTLAMAPERPGRRASRRARGRQKALLRSHDPTDGLA